MGLSGTGLIRGIAATKQPMRPSAKSLVDRGEVRGVRYSWVFRAAVP